MKRHVRSRFGIASLAVGLGAVALFYPVVSHSQGGPRPTLVRDAENPARQAFQARLECEDNDGIDQSQCVDSVSVPGGKRLVIETVSASVRMPAGEKPALVLGTTVDGVEEPHFLTLAFGGADGTDDAYYATHRVQVYADQGVVLGRLFNVDSSSTDPLRLVGLTISGHLVDCGAAPPGCPVP